ncbi:MAG: hypothetical protein MI919_27975 [Holophagales bacterium]|nr:hypothetical protein [Holophagales bacterium]
MPGHGQPTDDVEERILAFVRHELLGPGAGGVEVDRNQDLLSELLDSVAVLRLATFVDQEFGITTRPRDFVVENFQSAAILAAYVRRARGEALPSGS